MTPVIRVAGISKRYRIGPQRVAAYRTLRETVTDVLRKPLRRLVQRPPTADNEAFIWALRDVSFEVHRGDVVGIIGRNGAGKSTLLKILSRITDPTEGRAELRGRVGSLLEVGTGFHPELTGRENIYLNGAVLGMTRSEIERKFDAIVGFSGVESFLDTPVKRYSSGMYVRLAFAVAAHLEPEILIVDEVLAVGDLEFQRKCLGKMGEVARSGRTVLFVSHNMNAIRSLCPKAAWLDAGQLRYFGPVESAVEAYLRSLQSAQRQHASLADHPGRLPGSTPYFLSIELTDAQGQVPAAFYTGHTLVIRLRFRWPDLSALRLHIGIDDLYGTRLATLVEPELKRPHAPCQETVVRCTVPGLFLAPGSYALDVALGPAYSRTSLDTIESATAFDVIFPPGDQRTAYYRGFYGPLALPAHWITERSES